MTISDRITQKENRRRELDLACAQSSVFQEEEKLRNRKQTLLDEKKRLHWRQISVLLEAIVLAGVCFIPVSLNLLANSLTSLACGIQVESFRKIHGNGIATTMCIGNLRSGTQNLCDYIHTKEKKCLSKSILYYGVILCFIIGAVLGNVCISYMQEKAILVCAFFLLAAFIMMFIDREKEEHESRS